jgi:adenylate cyclase
MAILRRARAALRRTASWVLPEDGRPRTGGSVVVAAGAAAVGLLLAFGDAAQRLDYDVYDRLLRAVTRDAAPPADVVVVAIDEPSFRELGMEWPWPRRVHAALVDALARAGARTIVFDVVFDAPAADPENDELFADAIARAGNVILAVDRVDVRDSGYELVQWAEPVEPLARAAAGTGAANIVPDPDGVVRRAWPVVDARPSLALAAASRAGGASTGTDTMFRLLRFKGPSRRGITTVSYYQALGVPGDPASRPLADAGPATGPPAYSETGLLPPGFFSGKTVFVGRALQSAPDAMVDRFATPVDAAMPGVEIHATTFDALLRGRTIADAIEELWMLLATLVALAAASAWLARREGAALRWALGALLIGPATLALAYAGLRWGDVRLPVVPPVLVFVVTGGVVAAWRASLGARQRRLIRRAFEHYVSPAIVAELLRDPSKLAVGGDEYDLTVLFADLEGFTTFAERLAPAEVRARLNALLEIMVEAVVSNRGTVDKLLGDGLVALFGCPVRDADHAAQACRAALAIERGVHDLGRAWANEGLVPPRMRIGVASGRAVAGNFGTPTVFQFTAVGDVVNTASRLEGANRVYGTRILVGEATARAVADRFVLREIDRVRLKGRTATEAVHELLAARLRGATPDSGIAADQRDGSPGERALAQYARALEAYRQRRWDEAMAQLDAHLAASPGDPPAAVLRARCERFRREPPPPQWDGGFEMETK